MDTRGGPKGKQFPIRSGPMREKSSDPTARQNSSNPAKWDGSVARSHSMLENLNFLKHVTRLQPNPGHFRICILAKEKTSFLCPPPPRIRPQNAEKLPAPPYDNYYGENMYAAGPVEGGGGVCTNMHYAKKVHFPHQSGRINILPAAVGYTLAQR